MDSRRLRSIDRSRKSSPTVTVTSSLVSAVLEWCLIFMLFIHASFSYLLTKFACYCRLEIPCLFCSRLDHVLGNKRDGFYWDLICQKHKLKISSLIFCQLHNNLIDVHDTCENCVFSFATTNKSNAETYRLLVGKLGAEEPHFGLSQSDSSSTRKCSCCNEQWSSKPCARDFFYLKPVNYEREAEFDGSSLPFKPKDDRDEVPEVSQILPELDHKANHNTDSLPHIEYKRINITSDTESEAPVPDNGSAGVLIREVHKYSEPQIVALSEELINPAALTGFPLLVSKDTTTNSVRDVEFLAPLRHGLEELSWEQVEQNNDVSVPSELISCAEKLPSFDVNGTHCDESKETVSNTTELEKDVPVDYEEASKPGSDSRQIFESQNEVTIQTGEISKDGTDSILANETHIDSKPSKIDSTTQVADSLDLGDAYRIALGTRRQLSGRFLEHQRSMTDSTRASQDLKILLSQLSAVRGTEFSLNDISPRLSANNEDYKFLEACAPIGIHILQKRMSLERNESNLSLDGSSVSEIEGESAVDRLKRQVEHDKKIMSALYKELEEERNASAIAANQAMAMITRLQEEKASVQMEALQCLRMLEEQAEYDGEALQNANEMLVEKEREIQDFETKLKMYRNQIGHSSTIIEPRPDELNTRKSEANYGESNELDIVYKVGASNILIEKDIKMGRIFLLQCNDEKRYILQFVKKLEKTMSISNKDEFSQDMLSGEFAADGGIDASKTEEHECVGFSQESGRYDKFIYILHINGDAELDVLANELSAMKNRLETFEPEEKGSEGFELIKETALCLQEYIQTRLE